MARPEAQMIPVKPEEAIAFFRAKGFQLEPSFDWRDVSARVHAEAFTVAKSTGFDILGDIHAALDKAISEGRTLREFTDELTPILQAKGWWGRRDQEDPATGEVKRVQLGSPRRLRVIFQTNLRMAYMAGKWQRFMRLKEQRPWLRYVGVLDGRIRHLHRQWHGTILRWDHPWWVKHFPPNDFGCRCDVQSLSDRDLGRLKLKPSPTAPSSPERLFENPRTGEVSRVPDGVRPGFDHNVGQLAREAHAGKRLMDRLATLPPAMAAEAFAASQGFLLSGVSYEFTGWLRQVMGLSLALGSQRLLAALPPQALLALGPEAQAMLKVTDEVVRGLPEYLAADLPRLMANPLALARGPDGGLLLVVQHNAEARAWTCLTLDRDGSVTGSLDLGPEDVARLQLLWGRL